MSALPEIRHEDPPLGDRIERALDEHGPLPVLSGTINSLRQLCSDAESATEEIVATIEQDEALTTNLLRLANSAWLASRFTATSVRQAVMLIGRSELSRVALAAQTYSYLEQLPGHGRVSRGQLHLHAVTVASQAAAIASNRGCDVDTCYMAGLLHDLGKLVMPLVFGVDPVAAIALDHATGSARARREREELGADHAEIGALLARRSHVDEEVVTAIALHHGGSSEALVSPTPEAACVQLANILSGILAGDDPDQELLELALARLDLRPDSLDELAMLAAGSGSLASLTERVRRLERLACVDDLTGIANRRHWYEQAESRIATATEGGVLIVDVDHFKEVNDTFGHAAGDQVLQQIAASLAEQGIAGRLGGDEFAVWVDGEAGQRAAETVLEAAAELAVVSQLPVGLSIGIAQMPQHGREIGELLRNADAALYRAKQSGRNQFALAA
jgi:diguanylate cyclase (GGDEF)-like protein/putative nucleotidyltransferase with HDIG domain